MENSKLSAELKVHRRLLLTFTFLLFAIHILDVKIGSHASLQGLVVDFSRPALLVVALWIAWAWSCWRYWQYEKIFSDLDFENARHQALERAITDKVTSHIQGEVDSGAYVARKVKPGQRVNVQIQNLKKELSKTVSDWSFENILLEVQDPERPQPHPPLKVDGGANCRALR